MKGFIVYSDYDLIDEKTKVKLFGRLENGESFVALFDFEPYLFIAEKELKKVTHLIKELKQEETSLKNFKGEPVIKLSSDSHIKLNKIAHEIHETSATYESDIKPHLRFMMDNNLLSTLNIEGDYQTSEKVSRVYLNPQISPIKEEYLPNLKVASIDTESDKETGELFCIGITSKNYSKNFMITSHKDLKEVTACEDEADCLEKFKQELISLDPDIITGWNLIDFDLVDLQQRFRKNKIQFDLGRTNDNPRLRIEDNFFKHSTMDLPGRQVIDALSFIKDPFIKEAPSIKHAEFESYKLEDVSQALLKKGKLIKGKNKNEEISELYHKKTKDSHQKLADYNLTDCRLVYEILEKTKMIELSIERSQLTGLQLDKLTASIAAFDSLYLRELRKKHLVAPATRYEKKEERIKGGYVFSPNSGIYHNVLIFDFKSLYPSIIRTFNIDPASFLDKKEKNCIEAPNGACFKNQEGILPEIIQRLHEAREKARKEKRELSAYAIKVIMNSFFGVLASPNCRFFSLDMANAITYFGQTLIKLTAKEIEALGYKVIYQDTDSCFVEALKEQDEANKIGEKIQQHINKFYKEYTKNNYNRESFLELKFEKQYLSLLIPQLRGEGEKAAKKRYAGLVEKDKKEELEIVGLEAIRGDWTEAAQEFQRELLMKVFKNQSVEKFIEEFVKKIKSGSMDKKLVYRKSIRKSLDEYTKTTPPHVKAARQLGELDSNIIEYYQTTEGPEPIQKLKHKLDYEHYIEKQIKPIANQILVLLNKDFENASKNSKQAKLF